MDILKVSTDWAKAELLSNGIFILFGMMFGLASLGFWCVGKTDMARAFVIPTLVAGVLLFILGGGLLFSSQRNLAGFEAAYLTNAQGFVAGEIERVKATMSQYRIAVFRVMPLIVILSAALIIVVQGPVWRASLITTIAMITVIMLIDANANARLESYKAALLSARSAQ